MRQFEVAIKILHVYFYQAMILHIVIIKPVVFPVFYWDEFHISIIFEKVNIVFKHDIVEFDSHFQPTHYWFIGFRSGNMSMFIIFYLLLYLCSLQPVEVTIFERICMECCLFYKFPMSFVATSQQHIERYLLVTWQYHQISNSSQSLASPFFSSRSIKFKLISLSSN